MSQSHEGTLANLIAIGDHIESLIRDIAGEVSGQAMRAPSASIHDRLDSLVALEEQLAAVFRLVEHFEARCDKRYLHTTAANSSGDGAPSSTPYPVGG